MIAMKTDRSNRLFELGPDAGADPFEDEAVRKRADFQSRAPRAFSSMLSTVADPSRCPRLQSDVPMRCGRCGQAERVAVRRAKMVERDGHTAVVTGVPMEECPACGERWLFLEVAESLDAVLRRLISSGAATATANWEDLTAAAA